MKRLLDLVLAGAGLLVLAPLLLVLAAWVRLDSPGPALFRQDRVGLRGRPFRIHKFRTMTVGAPGAGPGITAAGDRRITAAGRFLRRYKLDELPQLWDVVVGHMSLVGPRPELARFVAHYPDEAREIVLSVRPGITDPVSIDLVDESELLAGAPDPERTYVETILPQKVQGYVDYVRTRSLAGDVALLFRTLRAIAGAGPRAGTQPGKRRID